MSFDEDFAAAEAEPTDFRDVTIELNGKPYTLRFLQWSGIEWAAETDNHPARVGVKVDKMYGYNIRTLALAAAKVTGRLVEGDKLTELSPERWDRIFKARGGGVVSRICDQIWELNENAPAMAVVRAKKASAANSGSASS
jgi:hypothetical protein